MSMKFIYTIAFIFFLVYLMQGCKKTSNPELESENTLGLPTTLLNYAAPVLPSHMLAPPVRNTDNTPANNPVTNAGATLGRVLFYDVNLSINNTISCASCHKQSSGFSDPLAFSKGFNGGNTSRSSMSLANAKYYSSGRFFWDERAASLEDQVLMPVQDAVEMGLTLPELTRRLQSLDYYSALFSKAFGDSNINPDRVSKALSQFIRSMVSYQSKYDIGRAAVTDPSAPFPNFSTEENAGKQLFLAPGSCAACHGTDAFNAPGLKNNGLDATVTDAAAGAANNNPGTIGKFKVPSLKNIGVSAPYMHDSRFTNLDQVIEHYSTGVKDNPSLDPPLRVQGGAVRLLNLSATQKNALKAFLLTLTDNAMLTDEKFSDPFKK